MDSAAQGGEIVALKAKHGLSRHEMDNLYHRYRCFENTEQNGFYNLDDFVEWAASENYEVGMKLKRIDESKPYSRENCKMVTLVIDGEYQRFLISRWESIMAPIRERFKTELAEIERKKEANKRAFFRYKHPDLVREGIVWKGN